MQDRIMSEALALLVKKIKSLENELKLKNTK